MSAKIILMRHGKPNFDFSRWITLDNFADFLHEYDTAEVIDKPPESAVPKRIATRILTSQKQCLAGGGVIYF